MNIRGAWLGFVELVRVPVVRLFVEFEELFVEQPASLWSMGRRRFPARQEKTPFILTEYYMCMFKVGNS